MKDAFVKNLSVWLILTTVLFGNTLVAMGETPPGEWSGKTQQGQTVTIKTTAGAVTEFSIGIERLGKWSNYKTIYMIPIVENSFSISDATYQYEIRGYFENEKSCRGTCSFFDEILGIEVTVTWEATPDIFLKCLGSSPSLASLSSTAVFGIAGITHEGSDLWVLTFEQIFNKIDSSGKVISSFKKTFMADDYVGLVFDGSHLWSYERRKEELHHLDTSGTLVSTHPLPRSYITTPVGSDIASFQDMAFDGENIWVLDNGFYKKLHKIDRTGKVLHTIPINISSSVELSGLAWDGKNFFITDRFNRKLHKLDQQGNLVGTTTITNVDSQPEHITFDGTFLWCEGCEQQSRLTQYLPPQKGDVDGDGIVTLTDFSAGLAILIGKGDTRKTCPPADLNGDGSFGLPDVLLLQRIVNDRIPTN